MKIFECWCLYRTNWEQRHLFPYLSCPHGTFKLHILELDADAIGEIRRFLKGSQVWHVCVNFHSVAVYNSAVMEFWPLPLEQRIKLFLISCYTLVRYLRLNEWSIMADIFKNFLTFQLVWDFVIWKIVPHNWGFTKFQLNLPYLGYNTVFRTLEIRHYGPVCDIWETGL